MFDLNKIMAAADELGIELKRNSSNPGFHFVSPDDTVRSVTYDTLERVVAQKFNNNHSEIQYNTVTSKKITCDINMSGCDINMDGKKLESTILPKHIKIKVDNTITEPVSNVDISNLHLSGYHGYNTFGNNKAA
ncbi:hypothetical protein CN947_13465 [Bacillus cereus]|nr:hypothetical protein CN947_13465 [Bacillus cereus]